MGFIKTTEGNVVHYGFIEQFICQLGERYNIREIAHDRWNATRMVQTLEDDGVTMGPFGQGFKTKDKPGLFSPPLIVLSFARTPEQFRAFS